LPELTGPLHPGNKFGGRCNDRFHMLFSIHEA
jgi:hypothetical protein